MLHVSACNTYTANIIILWNLIHDIAVSYTHLDVYKRQYANIAAAGRTAVNFFLIINSSLKICFSVLDDLIITFPSPYFYFYIALFCYYLAISSVFLRFHVYIFQHFIFFLRIKHYFIVYFNSFSFLLY